MKFDGQETQVMPEPATLFRSRLKTQLRARRILLAGFFLAVVLAAITVSAVWVSHRGATAEWRERISGLADMIGAHAKRTVESSDEVLLALGAAIHALDIETVEDLRAKLVTKAFQEDLASRIKGAPHIQMLAVIDRNGYVINNSMMYMQPYLFSQWHFLKDQLLDQQTDRVFSSLFKITIAPSSKPVIGLGRKLFSRSGELLGIIGVAISSGYFSDFYGSLPITDGYGVTLLNQSGVKLAAFPAIVSAPGEKTSMRELDRALTDIDQAIFIATQGSSRAKGDTSWMVAARRVPEISMVATASVSSDVYLRQWRWNASIFLICGISVTVATLFLTFAARRLFDEMEAARASAVAHAGVKTRFLSAMSHEIRTPLNAITVSADLMLGHRMPTEIGKFAIAIQRSSKQLLLLVNDILDFARLDAGQHRAREAPFELAPVLDMIMDVAQSLPGAEKLALRLEVSAETPAYLVGDCGVMTQVLRNLLGNAVKFTKDGSVVLAVAFDARLCRLVLDVIDTGCGIAQSQQDLVFRPFERGEAALAVTEGTGLGLTIARQLTESVGGVIRMHSAAGAGSTFSVELPMSAGHPELTSVDSLSAPAGHNSPRLRILVAEDVAANRMVIEALLHKHGHVVQLVTNGYEAIDAVIGDTFDAILMDVQMPEMDGLAATQAIRKMAPPAGQILIIGLTAFVEPEQQDLMRAAGMDVCLTKPLQMPDLLAALSGVSGI